MLVDADPQCNLTFLFLGEKFDSYYENASTKNENIKDAVANTFNYTTEPITTATCSNAKKKE